MNSKVNSGQCMTVRELGAVRRRWGLSEDEMARLLELTLGREDSMEVVRFDEGQPVVSETASRLIRILDTTQLPTPGRGPTRRTE